MNAQHLCQDQPLAEAVVLVQRRYGCRQSRPVDHRQPRQLQDRKPGLLIFLRVSGNERHVPFAFFQRVKLRDAKFARHLVGDFNPLNILELQARFQNVEHVIAANMIIASTIVQHGRVDDALAAYLRERTDRLS